METEEERRRRRAANGCFTSICGRKGCRNPAVKSLYGVARCSKHLSDFDRSIEEWDEPLGTEGAN